MSRNATSDEIRLTRYAGVMKSSFVMWMMMKSGFVTWYNQITYAKFQGSDITENIVLRRILLTNYYLYTKIFVFLMKIFILLTYVILKRNNVMWNLHYTIFRQTMSFLFENFLFLNKKKFFFEIWEIFDQTKRNDYQMRK